MAKGSNLKRRDGNIFMEWERIKIDSIRKRKSEYLELKLKIHLFVKIII